jgi:hypothetical protein
MHVERYLTALILTIIIETFIAVVIIRDKKFILLVIAAQIITNPALNFLIQQYPHLYFNSTYLFLLEIGVVILEWFFYLIFYKKQPFKLLLFSILSNGLSYGIGIFIQKTGLLR